MRTSPGQSFIEVTNAFALKFGEGFNCRFAVATRSSYDAHRPLLKTENLDLIFSYQKPGALFKNLMVQFEKVIYQIQSTRQSMLCEMPKSQFAKTTKER